MTAEEIKMLWGECSKHHKFTDGAFREAFARVIEREVLERFQSALAYAVSEADAWHDECRGTPIESERMDEVRALLLVIEKLRGDQ